MCVCVGVFFIFIAAKQRAEVPIFSNIAWILWDFLEWDFFSFLSNMMLWVFEILGLDLCDLIFNVEIKSVYWLSKEWLFVSMALKSESLQILYWVLRYWGVRSFNFGSMVFGWVKLKSQNEILKFFFLFCIATSSSPNHTFGEKFPSISRFTCSRTIIDVMHFSSTWRCQVYV